jgi:hypothetical protein
MSRKIVFLATGGMLILASLACTSPLPDQPATQTSSAETADAMLWTETPTITPTKSPIKSPTQTKLPTTDTYRLTMTRFPGSINNPNRFYETAGNVHFSYVPPSKWSEVKAKEGPFSAWKGPLDPSCFFCELSFMDEQSDLGSGFYAMIVEESILSNLPNYVLRTEDTFNTDIGVDSYQVIFNFESRGIPLFGMMFVFSVSDHLVYAVYTRLWDGNSDQDDVITQSMKTFQFEE